MKPAPLTRCALAALALVVTAGCTTKAAIVPSTATPTPVVATSGADRPSVMSYADAPRAVRTLLDHTGVEPIVVSAGAKLAVARHVVVAGDVDPFDLSQMAVEGDIAVDAVDRIDGRSFRGRVLILAPATESDYRAWAGRGHSDDWGITPRTPWHGGSTWIILHLSASGLSAATLDADPHLLRDVITHEMFHALTLTHGSRAPLWLTEGFAEVAGQKLGPPHLPKRVALPTDAQVDGHPLGYFLAWQFAAFLNHRVGHARAMRFYLAAVAPHRQAAINALSKRDLGASLPSLVRSWKKAYRAHGVIL